MFWNKKKKDKEIVINKSDKEVVKNAYDLESNGQIKLALEILKAHQFNFTEFKDELRLPKLLQQSGKFENAVSEIQAIINYAQGYTKKHLPHQSYLIKLGLSFARVSNCFDCLRIISKRAKSKKIELYAAAMYKFSSYLHGHYADLIWVENYKNFESWEVKNDSIDNKTYKAIIENFVVRKDFNSASKEMAKLLEIDSYIQVSFFNGAEMDFIDTTEFKNRLYFLTNSGSMFLSKAYDYWKKGDFDNAREMFQKVGYTIKTIETESSDYKKRKAKKHKDKIIKIQSNFASVDPLYNKVLLDVISQVDRNPGLIQSEIYGLLPYPKEDISYTLYFADVLHDLIRKKHGRSYALYTKAQQLNFNI